MSIISVRDYGNSRWKRNAKKQDKKKINKGRKEKGRTEAIVKRWELNDFVVHLSWVFSS